jgi:hypothetical protein
MLDPQHPTTYIRPVTGIAFRFVGLFFGKEAGMTYCTVLSVPFWEKLKNRGIQARIASLLAWARTHYSEK